MDSMVALWFFDGISIWTIFGVCVLCEFILMRAANVIFRLTLAARSVLYIRINIFTVLNRQAWCNTLLCSTYIIKLAVQIKWYWLNNSIGICVYINRASWLACYMYFLLFIWKPTQRCYQYKLTCCHVLNNAILGKIASINNI